MTPDTIQPSQDFLKPSTIGFIISCIKNEQYDELPPRPMIRQDDQGNYVAIDGHNLLAVMCFLGRAVDVHLAATASDGIQGHGAAIEQRNADLLTKFDSCLTDRDSTAAKGIKTMSDLVASHQSLFNGLQEG